VNVVLSRQNRVRVEGEIIRDIHLDASGLLVRKIGGPSVHPPLPPGITDLSYAGNFKWTNSSGEDRYRRGMYTFFKRTAPHPNLTIFDCPDANLTCVERRSSNTPLQALLALNNETFSESSRALARRLLSSSMANDRERIIQGFRLCVSRPPSGDELLEFEKLLTESRKWYETHQDQAKQLIGDGGTPNVSLESNAAWVATTRILVNLDEFITRE